MNDMLGLVTVVGNMFPFGVMLQRGLRGAVFLSPPLFLMILSDVSVPR